MASAYELQVRRLYPDQFVELSRLFIYYNARTIFGEISKDTGTTIRAGIKAVRSYGVCPESVWPYNILKFDVKPSREAYDIAKSRTIKSYSRLLSNQDVFDALANNQPVVIAITLFSDFMTLDKQSSTVPMPSPGSVEYGGHAMCLVGYDNNRQAFLAKNSFGVEWGDEGYCWIPYGYTDKYVFEQWVFDIAPPQS